MRAKRKTKTTALPKTKRQKLIDAKNKANGNKDAYLEMASNYQGKWPKYQ